MPYKSRAQEKYFNANRERLEAKGVNVEEFNKASKGLSLPEKVKPQTSVQKKRSALKSRLNRRK